MTIEQVQKIIKQGEGLTVEFKNAANGLPKSMFETMCSFLNKSGGYILLGVNDDRTIEGLDIDLAESYCKGIATISNNPNKLTPCFLVDTELVEIDGKNIVVVYVPISSQVHKLNVAFHLEKRFFVR